ncbi:MAG: hypothetical protein M3439_04340, partial [Chloroflexota bacterium]|nr:hypothetical protein [Chloroflexota bacterium]
NEGINASTKAPGHAAVAAYQTNPTSLAAALYAKKDGLVGHAGFFDGNVHVTGRIVAEVDICLSNADCAKEFDICDAALPEPGTVMVLSDSGGLRTSQRAYDKRVAGVVSGAGQYRPGIVLDSQNGQPNRQPIALLGKVYCKVDARYGPIAVGYLMTTSDTPGHAMLAEDRAQAFGTVIGKALQPFPAGSGLIPILIALQ